MSEKKPRILKDYEKLSEDIKEQIKLAYPAGYTQNLITYTDREGKLISALPFETEEYYYLVKMTKTEATRIVEDDDDFDDDGILKDDVKETYEEKYSDFDDEEDSDESGYDEPIEFDEEEDDD
ncbi:MAG TPA: hypothetical protein PLY32_01495 [Salinivirgaceae bacterium]|nr:hypothetical protein [Salinivirgaceae bacterium]HQA75771.1 hypothetical protein [Salinivirgaceae bacterium]